VAEAGMERVFYLCYSLVLRSLVICCVSLLSGRSAAWLARLVRDQEVEGSNPFAPTTSIPLNQQVSYALVWEALPI
jgi:hypothetical protein